MAQTSKQQNMRNEAYNMDCIEYMRSLPDNAFDIAVCDPPYGKGNDDSLVGNGGGGSDRDSKSTSDLRGARNHSPAHIETIRGMVQTLRQADGTDCWEDGEKDTTSQRTHTGSAEGRGRRDTKSGGAKQKLHNGMSLLLRSSSMSFSASAAIR